MTTDWNPLLRSEFEEQYWKELQAFVGVERGRATVYPPNDEVFAALHLTAYADTKVLILGQDPYHGARQAHGLCFSVRPGIERPPSLVNIHKELASDLGVPIPSHGSLEHWARQGVLLLNSVLTVRAHQAGSHAGKGWETFTDRVIAELSARREGVVFLLWGRYAQQKGAIVDTRRHHVLTAAHPSPFSAHNGFFGCRHFSRANALLEGEGQTAVDWRLPG